MTGKKSLKEILRSPWTIAGSATALLGGVLKIPLILGAWQGLYVTADGLFATLGALLFMSEHVSFIKSSWIIAPMVVIGAIVVYKRGAQWYDKFNDYV